MNTLKRKTLAVSVALALTVSAVPPVVAGGGGLTGGATEITQLLNNTELLDIAIKEAENLAYQIRQYEIMYENMRNLPNHIKQQALADLQALASIVATGRGVAYSSGQIDEDYQREHRSFEYYEQMQRGETGQRDHAAFSERYRDWSEVNHDSVRGALRAAGLQAQQFDREDSALRTIEAQMESAAGTKQLLQAGGSIAAMQVEQLQKLRQLQMAQIQLQSAQVGGSIDRQAEDDADLQRALRPLEGLNENRGGGLGWGGSVR
jgi:P-type conjugative transfer protein TrbJ